MSYGSLPSHHRNNLLLHVESHRYSENQVIIETTPLIAISSYRERLRNNETVFIDWKLSVLIAFFVCGIFIGFHLLFVEYNENTPNFPYYHIDLSTWYHESKTMNLTKLNLPVKNLIILQTQSGDCSTIRSCSMLINSMITNDLYDIKYNYMINNIGECYEIRGFKFVSGFTNYSINNESVVLALTGNYTIYQLNEIDAFISEAIRNKQLIKDFKIYGVQNNFFELYDSLKKKKEWKGYL
ncbi:hypothetical protein PVAND_004897 [Polypedilum vanderplanki]|uniref:Peptidoglycan recognition protein family domain-containing protein n=1 Tax=Polypedilum vanderplanki TaxID=319348 RepID=A0A9J6BY99_POLVA|nr:hypothetical protein PVAND_004897 [Polypedilum vanderplanki]